MSDLNEVIMDSMDDALTPEQSANIDSTSENFADASTEESTLAQETNEETTVSEEASSTLEGNQETEGKAPVDEFAKRFGIPQTGFAGRENRIPYSRVKKIVEKAQRDEATRLTKELESKFQPQLTDFQTKVQDYEGRLQKVAQFEQILENDPQTFLNMLSQVPAYKPFFDYINQLSPNGPQAQPQQSQAPAQSAEMPQPDQPMADGSKVYSMEGLQKLLDWQAHLVEERAVRSAEERVSKRYAPIEQEWQANQRMQQAMPQIERQIAEARKWDKFVELEPRVIEMLKTDRNISLEGAYIRAYQEAVSTERERLTSDKNKVRAEVLDEIKRRPTSTSAPIAPVRSMPQEQQGQQSIDEIIRESMRNAGLTDK